VKILSFLVFCLLMVFAVPAFASAPQEAAEWTYCFRDVNYTPEFQFSVKSGVIRGQAILAGHSSYPAPLTGYTRDGCACFSIAYRNETGLRFYKVKTSTRVGTTWGILNDTADYYDPPHSAELVPCTAATTEPGGGSGAMK
jgi:hypothetical protein